MHFLIVSYNLLYFICYSLLFCHKKVYLVDITHESQLYSPVDYNYYTVIILHIKILDSYIYTNLISICCLFSVGQSDRYSSL